MKSFTQGCEMIININVRALCNTVETILQKSYRGSLGMKLLNLYGRIIRGTYFREDRETQTE